MEKAAELWRRGFGVVFYGKGDPVDIAKLGKLLALIGRRGFSEFLKQWAAGLGPTGRGYSADSLLANPVMIEFVSALQGRLLKSAA